MPKAASKSSKKKKYNARFPPARIKKIMQTDEEVGKVAAAVPVIISRALEMFIESLILKSAKATQEKNAKTLSTSHMKQIINAEKQFDFLRDLVKNVPDHQTEDNNGDAPVLHEIEPPVKRSRGRPRKSTDTSKPGRKNKSAQAKTSSDTSDEVEDYDMEDDEDTETDEEEALKVAPLPIVFSDRLLPAQPMDKPSNGAAFYQPGFSGSYSHSTATVPMPSLLERSNLIHCPPSLLPIQAQMSSLPPISHPPPTHLMPQISINTPENLPINLSNSNPSRPPATGSKEDNDYDS